MQQFVCYARWDANRGGKKSINPKQCAPNISHSLAMCGWLRAATIIDCNAGHDCNFHMRVDVLCVYIACVKTLGRVSLTVGRRYLCCCLCLFVIVCFAQLVWRGRPFGNYIVSLGIAESLTLTSHANVHGKRNERADNANLSSISHLSARVYAVRCSQAMFDGCALRCGFAAACILIPAINATL